MEYEKRVQAAIREIAAQGLAESAHDLSDGGLAVAVAESAFGPAKSARKSISIRTCAPELLLFHEGPSRVLVSTADPEGSHRDRAEACASNAAKSALQSKSGSQIAIGGTAGRLGVSAHSKTAAKTR